MRSRALLGQLDVELLEQLLEFLGDLALADVVSTVFHVCEGLKDSVVRLDGGLATGLR